MTLVTLTVKRPQCNRNTLWQLLRDKRTVSAQPEVVYYCQSDRALQTQPTVLWLVSETLWILLVELPPQPPVLFSLWNQHRGKSVPNPLHSLPSHTQICIRLLCPPWLVSVDLVSSDTTTEQNFMTGDFFISSIMRSNLGIIKLRHLSEWKFTVFGNTNTETSDLINLWYMDSLYCQYKRV
jgi:hypothetical protein